MERSGAYEDVLLCILTKQSSVKLSCVVLKKKWSGLTEIPDNKLV